MTEEITEHRDDLRGRYVLKQEGGESELTYVVINDRMVIDHTYTPPALRGHGAAAKLIMRAVADARARGWKVIPQCPYVKIKIDRTPDLQDVLDPDWRGPA
ncbi:GNAT family N-acetyltransferase [Maricaulaceae bacterium MS644]